METWDDVEKIIGAIIGALGGISVISIAVIKFSSNIIADRLSKKFSLEIDKKFEDYKVSLEKKNYVSKVKFDKEFEIYSELSVAITKSIFSLSFIADYLEGDSNYFVLKEKFNSEIKTNYNTARELLIRYSPFIDANISEKYTEILDDVRQLLTNMQYIGKYEKNDTLKSILKSLEKQEMIEIRQKCYDAVDLYDSIKKREDETIDNLREYFKKLEVLD